MNQQFHCTKNTASSAHNLLSEFIEALERGIQAISDPRVEAKVTDYFARNPTRSSDMVHVAAVACRFQAEAQ